MQSNVRAALGRGRRSSQSDTPTVWFNPGQQAARVLECAPREPQETGLKIQLRAPFKGPPSTGQSGNGRGGEKTPCFLERPPEKAAHSSLRRGRAGPAEGKQRFGKAEEKSRGVDRCVCLGFFFFCFSCSPLSGSPYCTPSALLRPRRARRCGNKRNPKTRICISRDESHGAHPSSARTIACTGLLYV